MPESAPTIFITGAAAGIGRATALAFARQGYRVGAYDIDPAGLASLDEAITALGGDIATGRLDVTDAAEWARQLETFTGSSRRLDILVNNAGVLSSGRFEDIALPVQRRMVDTNVYGTMAGLHTAFPYLRGTSGAQVVNLCSASAIYGQPELATYSATKFAVRGLTEAIELEWRRHDIRAIAMWPLFVATGMVDGLETASTKSLGVHLTAEDVADEIYAATHPNRTWLARGLSRVHYPVGRQAKVFTGLAQAMPNRVQRLLNKAVSGT